MADWKKRWHEEHRAPPIRAGQMTGQPQAASPHAKMTDKKVAVAVKKARITQLYTFPRDHRPEEPVRNLRATEDASGLESAYDSTTGPAPSRGV
jgi:hypothetical protein